MSLGLPSLKPKPEVPDRIIIPTGAYGIPDVMSSGIASTRSKLASFHPLEQSEQKYSENRHQMNLAMLRSTQGIHAPLRLTMELKAAKQIGRLPFLSSSGFMTDVLTGRYEEIGFEDILNTDEFLETMGQPHAVVEKSLGIL